LLFINCEVIKKVVLPTWHLCLSHRNPTAQNANHKRHWKKKKKKEYPKTWLLRKIREKTEQAVLGKKIKDKRKWRCNG
jgi:hypothetical protein